MSLISHVVVSHDHISQIVGLEPGNRPIQTNRKRLGQRAWPVRPIRQPWRQIASQRRTGRQAGREREREERERETDRQTDGQGGGEG